MIARILALDLYLNAGDNPAAALPGGFIVPASTGVFASAESNAPGDLADVSVLLLGGNQGSAEPPEASSASAVDPAAGISLVPPAVVIPAAVAQSRWTSIEEDEEKEKTALQVLDSHAWVLDMLLDLHAWVIVRLYLRD